MMQLGFALLTIGSVRAKSAKSVALKNIMDAAFGGVGYFFFGWAFAYGDKLDADGNSINNAFIGTNNFAMSTTEESKYNTFLFQYVFAISTATIVSGAVAERVKFIAYALYAFFLTAWVYPVLTHWVWTTSGWASPTRLASLGPLFIGSGVYDTVGSGAVHMMGGVAGLAGAWVAGPRRGRFDANGKPVTMPGHNAVLYMSGVLLLWFGFYGFNPGTMGQLIAADGTSFSGVVARCAISTTMGGCFGGTVGIIVQLIYSKLCHGQAIWDLTAAGNCALTGMIVITSGCATLEPWAAALGGVVGGLIVLPSSLFVSHVLKIDDPVDAFVVHGIGGAAGVIWYALMAHKEFVTELYGAAPDGGQRHWGWWQGDYPNVLGANVIWCLVIFGWTFAMMAPFFYVLKLCGLLRISPEEEELGADISKHGGSAYPGMENMYNEHEASVKNGSTFAKMGNGHTDSHADKISSLEAELTALTNRVNKMSPA
ncbi:hypothetical protein CVIRNUC_001167 [Coccomyxa viridis]|uniref:Ammonium transporter AmtB-like domain-containing protein n=1 Tax=Coccomyxa viridis TaxID=1274662 RepID=A0AAV1HUM2_9CHLO|nr:hypothetical protein CVIRNUC_001167 [Coccomyxa viridis]